MLRDLLGKKNSGKNMLFYDSRSQFADGFNLEEEEELGCNSTEIFNCHKRCSPGSGDCSLTRATDGTSDIIGTCRVGSRR